MFEVFYAFLRLHNIGWRRGALKCSGKLSCALGAVHVGEAQFLKQVYIIGSWTQVAFKHAHGRKRKDSVAVFF